MSLRMIYLTALLPLLLLSACTERRPTPPFDPSDQIEATRGWMLKSPRNPSGKGISIHAWTLNSPTERISAAISPDLIRKSRIWNPAADNKRLNEVLTLLTGIPEYSAVSKSVTDVRAEPDAEVLFTEFSKSKTAIERSTLWLCSPGKKTLIYINYKDRQEQ